MRAAAMTQIRRTAQGAAALLALVALVGLTACSGVKAKDDPAPVGGPQGGAGSAGTESQGSEGAGSASQGSEGAGSEGAGGGGQDTTPQPAREAEGPRFSAKTQKGLDSALDKLASGDDEGARASLERMISDPEAGFLASYNLGVLDSQRGDLNQAQQRFEEALEANPDFSPAVVGLAQLFLRQGNTGQALQACDRAIAQRPENLGHRAAKLDVLNRLGRYEDTIREAKQILQQDERNVQSMMHMASAYQQLGKFELAESILLQVEERVSGVPALQADVRYRLGFVYLSQKSEGKARLSFEKAIELRPDFAEARNNLGVMYHRARDYEAAVEQFEASLKYFPEYKEAYLNLGNACKGQRDYDRAEDSFKRAIRLDGSYAQAYFNLGLLYLDGKFEGRDRKEQFQQAIDNFNRYKSELKSGLPREDPSDQYIGEALKKIELEKQREEQDRNAAKEAEENPEPEENPEENPEEAPPEDEATPEEQPEEEDPGEDR